MKKCPNCRRAVESGNRFCPYCGGAVPEKKKTKLWVWLLAAVLVIGLAVGSTYLIFDLISENRWQLRYDLGIACLEDEEYEDALTAFLNAIALDAGRADAYLGAADALLALDAPEEALDILEDGYRNTEDKTLKKRAKALEEELETAESAALSVNGHKFTAVELNYYFYAAVQEFVSAYGEYAAYFGLDVNLPLDQQVYDEASGMTWADYFLEEAIRDAVTACVVSDAAAAQGYELPETDRAALESQMDTLELHSQMYGYDGIREYLQAVFGAGAALESYTAYLERSYLVAAYYADRSAALAYTDGDVQRELEANGDLYASDSDTPLVNVRHILIMPQGGTTDPATGMQLYSDEEWYAAEQEAQAIYDAWLRDGGTEEAFARYASQYTADYGSSQNGGLYTEVYPGQMVSSFNDWCFDSSRQPGDSGMVRTDYGWHLMYFVSFCENSHREQQARENLRLRDMEQWLTELTESADVIRGSTDGIRLDMIIRED